MRNASVRIGPVCSQRWSDAVQSSLSGYEGIDGEEISMSQVKGGGQVSRRGFLRFLPAAVVGGSVLGAAKSDGPSSDEALEQAFLGGLLLCPNAISVYQPM